MYLRFEIKGELPTLNEYSRAERTSKYHGNNVKQTAQEMIMRQIPKVETISEHVFVYFTWIRSNARFDKDNVSFAKKFILDALQERKIIIRDSWRKVTPIDRDFLVNARNPRTVVEISSERLDEWKN